MPRGHVWLQVRHPRPPQMLRWRRLQMRCRLCRRLQMRCRLVLHVPLPRARRLHNTATHLACSQLCDFASTPQTASFIFVTSVAPCLTTTQLAMCRATTLPTRQTAGTTGRCHTRCCAAACSSRCAAAGMVYFDGALLPPCRFLPASPTKQAGRGSGAACAAAGGELFQRCAGAVTLRLVGWNGACPQPMFSYPLLLHFASPNRCGPLGRRAGWNAGWTCSPGRQKSSSGSGGSGRQRRRSSSSGGRRTADSSFQHSLLFVFTLSLVKKLWRLCHGRRQGENVGESMGWPDAAMALR